MRKMLIVFALSFVAACSGGGDAERPENATAECQNRAQTERQESQSTDGAEQAALTYMRRWTDRQWGALYDSLHPVHQELVTCEQLVKCALVVVPVRRSQNEPG